MFDTFTQKFPRDYTAAYPITPRFHGNGMYFTSDLDLFKYKRRQRSRINKIKHHTWPSSPHGKVTKTQ